MWKLLMKIMNIHSRDIKEYSDSFMLVYSHSSDLNDPPKMVYRSTKRSICDSNEVYKMTNLDLSWMDNPDWYEYDKDGYAG